MQGKPPIMTTTIRRLGLLAPLAALSLAGCGLNSVPTAEENVNAKWGDLQSEYQRRSDLIPNLVATVKGAAQQEKSVLVEVTEARANANKIQLNGDDDNLRALGAMSWTRVVRVGTGENNDVRIADFKESPAGAEFRLLWRGELWGHVKWTQPGIFNARNAAMAATGAQLSLLPPEAAVESVAEYVTHAKSRDSLRLDALARFRGVKRRQEILLGVPKLSVIEDFGHHPTALAETLGSFRARFPGAGSPGQRRSNGAPSRGRRPA